MVKVRIRLKSRAKIIIKILFSAIGSIYLHYGSIFNKAPQIGGIPAVQQNTSGELQLINLLPSSKAQCDAYISF